MKAGEVYRKTAKFMWMKLGLGLAVTVVSIILFVVFLGIGVLTKSLMVMNIMFLIWFFGVLGIARLVNHYVGYLIKAGHIAVITETVTTGVIPENQFEFGKNAVKSRFATSNVYFIIDKLLGGAIRQLQKILGRVTGLLGNIPGMDAVQNFLDMFIKIVLGYVDECCLGWTFYKKDENAFKAAADGVVIYFQNWKIILKSAAITALLVLVITGALSFLMYSIVNGVLLSLSVTEVEGMNVLFGIFALIVSIRVALSIKQAFIDSWILCKMLTSYMQVAPSTVITFDLYEKLCGFSASFKKMFKRAGITPEMAAVGAGAGVATVATMPNNVQTTAPRTKYCPNCGTPLDATALFCAGCGTKQ